MDAGPRGTDEATDRQYVEPLLTHLQTVDTTAWI